VLKSKSIRARKLIDTFNIQKDGERPGQDFI